MHTDSWFRLRAFFACRYECMAIIGSAVPHISWSAWSIGNLRPSELDCRLPSRRPVASLVGRRGTIVNRHCTDRTRTLSRALTQIHSNRSQPLPNTKIRSVPSAPIRLQCHLLLQKPRATEKKPRDLHDRALKNRMRQAQKLYQKFSGRDRKKRKRAWKAATLKATECKL